LRNLWSDQSAHQFGGRNPLYRLYPTGNFLSFSGQLDLQSKSKLSFSLIFTQNSGNALPAQTPRELRACIAADPRTGPSTHLADDSFAAWCYDNLSLKEARSAFERDAGADECEQWGLTALGWKAQVEMAIIALAATARMSI
jgi:hypothetical protein